MVAISPRIGLWCAYSLAHDGSVPTLANVTSSKLRSGDDVGNVPLAVVVEN
jgi:hypothetical protein